MALHRARHEAGPKHGIGIPGQVNTYRAEFDAETKRSLKLVLDDVEQDILRTWAFSAVGETSGYVNGKRRRRFSPHLAGQVLPRSGHLRPRGQWAQRDRDRDAQPPGPSSTLNEPAYLVGSFSVLESTSSRPHHGAWAFSQQVPHFVGIARYSQT